MATVEGLAMLRSDQQQLFLAWVDLDTRWSGNPQDTGLASEVTLARLLLEDQGIYPAYDPEEEVYTYIFG